jgi:GspD-like, N0 domain
MRPQENVSMLDALVSTGVVLCVLFSSGAGPASATPSGAISFENADIQTVVKQVAALTGITFLFDPEQVRGKITLLSPKGVDGGARPPEVCTRVARVHPPHQGRSHVDRPGRPGSL